MLRKLIKECRKNFFYFMKDSILFVVTLLVFLGTVVFLYKFYHDREAQGLNIILTAFVSRVTGREFLEIIQLKIKTIIHTIVSIVYKKEYIDYHRYHQLKQIRALEQDEILSEITLEDINRDSRLNSVDELAREDNNPSS